MTVDALQIDGLCKSYGGLAAVQPTTFSLAPGHALGFYGPTGCGKTTLLRMIAGLALPDEGSITIAGRLANNPALILPPSARGIGMVFQDLALWPHMTAERHLDFVLKRIHRDRHARRTEIFKWLDQMNLTGHAAKRPAEMSRGQRQRLAVARALCVNPNLILLDEPVSSQDDRSANRLLELFLSIKSAGTAMVVASHNKPFLDAIADHVRTFEEQP